MTNVVDWPDILKNHATSLPILSNATASAGRALGGSERVISNDAGFWTYKFTTMIYRKQPGDAVDKIMAFRGLFARTQGRLGLVRVPFYDPADIYLATGIKPRGSRPFTDGHFFSDGKGFVDGDVSAICFGNALQGDTSVNLIFPLGMTPMPGQWFSDGDRAYMITAAANVGGSGFSVSFLPRLRQPIAANATLSLTQIKCIMRLANDQPLAAAMSLANQGRIDLEWQEALL